MYQTGIGTDFGETGGRVSRRSLVSGLAQNAFHFLVATGLCHGAGTFLPFSFLFQFCKVAGTFLPF